MIAALILAACLLIEGFWIWVMPQRLFGLERELDIPGDVVIADADNAHGIEGEAVA